MAKLLLIDQLPRHILRVQPEKFSTDGVALQLAERLSASIALGAQESGHTCFFLFVK
tara:strand:+ start:4049 stop:4219 length:171 start_codon:yes stop_codon:yes gene_type:complete